MKKWGVSARKVACQGFALGCLIFIQLMGARSARAESPRKVEGNELLGTLGYGFLFRDLTTTNDRQVNPFGVTVGADFGYTFPFGLRLGTDASYAFGSKTEYSRWMGWLKLAVSRRDFSRILAATPCETAAGGRNPCPPAAPMRLRTRQTGSVVRASRAAGRIAVP